MKKTVAAETGGDSIMIEAAAFLESWGRWAASGDEARRMGRLGSTLRPERGGHGGDEIVAGLVDRALAALGDDARLLALLAYKEGLPGKEVARRLGVSPATLEKRVACVKVAAFVMVKARHENS